MALVYSDATFPSISHLFSTASSLLHFDTYIEVNLSFPKVALFLGCEDTWEIPNWAVIADFFRFSFSAQEGKEILFKYSSFKVRPLLMKCWL